MITERIGKKKADVKRDKIIRVSWVATVFLLSLVVGLSNPGIVAGQTIDPAADGDQSLPRELSITLDEAIQIALVNNYMIRKGHLNIEMADQQIREAWSSVYPQISASGSYTRNIVSPNPFAGSDAGGLFELFGALEWLSYNETARTDDDPGTDPITFEEFMNRQQQGMEEAGIDPTMDDNPFAIDNQFNFGVSLTQPLYNGSAFSAIRGARHLRDINQQEFQREQQEVVQQIKGAFYGALLAKEQTTVLKNSVERLERTVDETRASVEAGVLSSYDQMSAEVELVNMETDLIETENRSEMAVKNLALFLGIPVEIDLQLEGELEFTEELDPEMASSDDAYNLALTRRPDLEQAGSFLDLLDVNQRMTRAEYFPVVNAVANAGYVGQVPDSRQITEQRTDNAFEYDARQLGFFDRSYWDPAISVGIQIQWNIFDGFSRSSRVQQNKIDRRQAEIDQEMLKNSVRLEVEQVIADLETAYRRIMSQQRNIEQAETNYEHARRRLSEGVGTSLEERQASSLLDQSRLNYLSAVYDYLTAVSRFEKVTGKPVMNDGEWDDQ